MFINLYPFSRAKRSSSEKNSPVNIPPGQVNLPPNFIGRRPIYPAGESGEVKIKEEKKQKSIIKLIEGAGFCPGYLPQG
jgi:hypothetical protein